MAVEADPDMIVLLPVCLEKRVVIGIGMDARFPFFINLPMTCSAFFGLERVESCGNRLKWNSMGIIIAQDKITVGLISV